MAKAQDGSNWLGDLSDNWSQAMGAWQSLAKAVPGIEAAMGKIAEPSQAFNQFFSALGPGLSQGGLSATDISKRWREVLGQGSANPFTKAFGQGMQGFDFNQFAAPMLDAIRREAMASLDTPAFGPAREQQERWQALLKAQVENQQAQRGYQDLMTKVTEQAFARFESKLAEHEAPGRQLTSVRALYDLWIDAAEEAYAELALGKEFANAYGAMVNAQMRVRAATQTEVEQVCRALGMPTRSEVTASHRKVHALERELRALRAELAANKRVASAAPVPARPTIKPAPAKASKAAAPSKAKPKAKPADSTNTSKPKAKRTTRSAASRPGARKAAAKPRPTATAKAAPRRRKGA